MRVSWRLSLIRGAAVASIFALTATACTSDGNHDKPQTKAEQLDKLIDNNTGGFYIPLSQKACDITSPWYLENAGLKLTGGKNLPIDSPSAGATCSFKTAEITYWAGPDHTTLVFDDVVNPGWGGGTLALDVSKGSPFYGASEGIRYTDSGKPLNTVVLRDPGAYSQGVVVEIKALSWKDATLIARAVIKSGSSY